MSDISIKHDLEKVRCEVQRGIVLLFDEANVLAKSRIHLQKLRNIFLNMSGYMLVVTGTPELFPLMDDVFSPIIRQFKKINVGNFSDMKETEACVSKRLQSVGLSAIEMFRSPERAYREIHELSRGRPYEVQLICHIMFRRIQERRANRMELDFGVLEEVRRELEVSQDMSTRPLLPKIRNLSERQLNALGTVAPCDSPASFDNSWALEYIFHANTRWTKEALEHCVRNLESEGVLTFADGVVTFCGDDFDKIYARYFAREKGVWLGFVHLPFDTFATFNISDYIEESGGLDFLVPIGESVSEPDLTKLVQRLVDPDPKDDPYVDATSSSVRLYHAMMRYHKHATLPAIRISLNLGWLRTSLWYYAENPSDHNAVPKCLEHLREAQARVKELGGDLTVDTVQVPVAQVARLVEAVHRTANKQVQRRISNLHMLDMHTAYIERHDLEEALFLADLLLADYAEKLSSISANNAGYVYLAAGDLPKARQLFARSIQESDTADGDFALPLYNIGVLDAREGKLDSAIDHLRRAQEIWTRHPPARVDCLYSVSIVDGALQIEEVQNPDPRQMVEQAIRAIERLGGATDGHG